MGHLSHNLSSKVSEVQEGVGIWQEPEVGNDCEDVISSGHSRSVSHMKPQCEVSTEDYQTSSQTEFQHGERWWAGSPPLPQMRRYGSW